MCNADPTTSRNETEKIRKFKFAGGMDVILQNNKTLDWAFSKLVLLHCASKLLLARGYLLNCMFAQSSLVPIYCTTPF